MERGAEVVDAWTGGDAAHATLETGGSREDVTCRFIVGCDGPDSTVRE